MSKLSVIKTRIKTISEVRQIASAMKLSASSQLRAAKNHASAACEFRDILREALAIFNLNFQSTDNFCRVIIGADLGLAGGFSTNLAKFLQEQKNCVKTVIIGKKFGGEFASGKITIDECDEIAKNLSVFSGAQIIFTDQTSRPRLTQIPLEFASYDDFPDAREILRKLFAAEIFAATRESTYAELLSRSGAMEAADKNAGEMLENLRVRKNMLSQQSVTREIQEVIGGCNNE